MGSHHDRERHGEGRQARVVVGVAQKERRGAGSAGRCPSEQDAGQPAAGGTGAGPVADSHTGPAGHHGGDAQDGDLHAQAHLLPVLGNEDEGCCDHQGPADVQADLDEDLGQGAAMVRSNWRGVGGR